MVSTESSGSSSEQEVSTLMSKMGLADDEEEEPLRWLPPGLPPPARWDSIVDEPRLPGLLVNFHYYGTTYYPTWKEILKRAPEEEVIRRLGDSQVIRLGIDMYNRELKEWYKLNLVRVSYQGHADELVKAHSKWMVEAAVETIDEMATGCYPNGPSDYVDFLAEFRQELVNGKATLPGICWPGKQLLAERSGPSRT